MERFLLSLGPALMDARDNSLPCDDTSTRNNNNHKFTMQLFASLSALSGALCDNVVLGSLLLRQRSGSQADHADCAQNQRPHHNHNASHNQAERHAGARKGEPIFGCKVLSTV